MTNIIVKKKRNQLKKRLIRRAGILALIYFTSFFSLYAIFGEKPNLNPGQNAPAFANKGEEYLAKGEFPQSLEYFSNLFSQDENDYYAANRIGKTYLQLQDYEKAKFYFFLSKEIAPYYIENYSDLATLYIETNDLISAENIIRLMPLKKESDAPKKAYAYKKLSEKIDNTEEKILYYNLVLDYLKNSKKRDDIALYNQTVDDIANTYYEIANSAIKNDNFDLALSSYNSILNYKNTPLLQTNFAKLYLTKDTNKAMQSIKEAFYLAKTQEDKRTVKEQLIKMFYFFEKEGDVFNQKLCKSYLVQLGEDSILIDEREAIINISNINTSVKHYDTKYFPAISFQITNNSKTKLNHLYVKAVIFSQKEHTVEEIQEQILPDLQKELNPAEKSKPIDLIFNSGFRNPERIKNCKINLYFSTNTNNWILYREINKIEDIDNVD